MDTSTAPPILQDGVKSTASIDKPFDITHGSAFIEGLGTLGLSKCSINPETSSWDFGESFDMEALNRLS